MLLIHSFTLLVHPSVLTYPYILLILPSAPNTSLYLLLISFILCLSVNLLLIHPYTLSIRPSAPTTSLSIHARTHQKSWSWHTQLFMNGIHLRHVHPSRHSFRRKTNFSFCFGSQLNSSKQFSRNIHSWFWAVKNHLNGYFAYLLPRET